MKNIGTTLKYLRESRGFSQRAVSNGIVDYSYYSRIENNKNNITHLKLVEILKRLDISIEEFTYLNGIQNDIKNVNLRKPIVKAFYEADVEELKKLKTMFKKRFNDTKNWNDRYHYILCSYFISQFEDSEFEEEFLEEILQYFDTVTYYTENDVKILADFYKKLPQEMVFYIYKKMFIEHKSHSAYELSRKNTILFHLNMLHLAFTNEKYKYALEILALIKEEYTGSADSLAIAMSKYYDGLFIILSEENVDEGIELAEKGIMVLEICDLNYHAKLHRDELEKLKRKVGISKNI
ncbi:helix-turn-helix domain-containing protein [Isobaculum melis]|uniref:Transcriptional activator, Rgg/GadR/MutR family, C-terminal domain-containing protein n=1 Tax=Isobaculum melis TaxID=142588 RepID=A0A1H9SCQ5_9LACT|nr:Rgg/GadR/MutR family transcriptional regulator [Isobaculum melis]SER82784.1 transcriptional activator, Rgg/GadR/MutR family, C-terminal domain-containing protein [Isobaculum melis]